LDFARQTARVFSGRFQLLDRLRISFHLRYILAPGN